MRTKAELVTDALKTCVDQYSNYSLRYGALDTKAQGTATIGGVLLAAVLAFIPQAAYKVVLSFYGRPGVYPAIGVLSFAVCGIVFAIYSLRVRPGRIPFAGQVVAQGVLDLLALADDERTDDAIERHYTVQLREWVGTLVEMGNTINAKSGALRISQLFIAGAGMAVAIFAGFALEAIT
jgi:uncharacterized integral membrane protein